MVLRSLVPHPSALRAATYQLWYACPRQAFRLEDSLRSAAPPGEGFGVAPQRLFALQNGQNLEAIHESPTVASRKDLRYNKLTVNAFFERLSMFFQKGIDSHAAS